MSKTQFMIFHCNSELMIKFQFWCGMMEAIGGERKGETLEGDMAEEKDGFESISAAE